METIIVKPKTIRESKAVLDFLRKTKIKAEVYKESSKKEILDSIERGAKEASEFLKGKRKLRDIQDLLDEI